MLIPWNLEVVMLCAQRVSRSPLCGFWGLVSSVAAPVSLRGLWRDMAHAGDAGVTGTDRIEPTATTATRSSPALPSVRGLLGCCHGTEMRASSS